MKASVQSGLVLLRPVFAPETLLDEHISCPSYRAIREGECEPTDGQRRVEGLAIIAPRAVEDEETCKRQARQCSLLGSTQGLHAFRCVVVVGVDGMVAMFASCNEI